MTEPCGTCGGTGAIPAGGWEPAEDVDNGYVQCPDCAESAYRACWRCHRFRSHLLMTCVIVDRLERRSGPWQCQAATSCRVHAKKWRRALASASGDEK